MQNWAQAQATNTKRGPFYPGTREDLETSIGPLNLKASEPFGKAQWVGLGRLVGGLGGLVGGGWKSCVCLFRGSIYKYTPSYQQNTHFGAGSCSFAHIFTLRRCCTIHSILMLLLLPQIRFGPWHAATPGWRVGHTNQKGLVPNLRSRVTTAISPPSNTYA